MSAEDKVGGYASGVGDLDVDAIAANLAGDFELLDENGVVHERAAGRSRGFSDEIDVKYVSAETSR